MLHDVTGAEIHMPMRRAEREKVHELRERAAIDQPHGKKGHHDRGGF